MTILNIPDKKVTIKEFTEIKEFLNKRAVFFDKWETAISFPKDADQTTILKAYEPYLKPFMGNGGYTSSDVISVHPETEGIVEIRKKFNKEHTHTDDEVRFIVDGQGIFWFNLGNEDPIFSLLCTAGIIISVPANTKHWFDMGGRPFIKAIRIYTDEKGWVGHYTDSGIEKNYTS